METQPTATAYLIVGFIGSGKTTFAKKLEKQTGALRITKDEWLIRLIGHDPRVDGFDRLDESVTELSFDIALKCLRAGVDVIIDDGFWVRSQRDEMRTRIADIGATARLYFLKCSVKVMRDRIRKRNQGLTEDAFLVDEALFDSYLQYYDEPGSDEDCTVIENE